MNEIRYKESSLSFWLSIIFLLISFGYPLTISIPVLTGVSSNSYNIILKLLYLSLSLVLIFYIIKKKYIKGLKYPQWYFMIFWILYGCRLIYDLSIRGIRFAEKDAFYVYAYAFGTSLIPSIAILLGTKFMDLSQFVKKMYIIFILATITVLYLYFSNADIQMGLLAERANIKMNSAKEDTVLNPITISLCGEYLFLSSLIRGLFFKVGWVEKLLIPIFLIVGLFTLILGGSRGPFLITILLLLLLLLLFYKKKKISVLLVLKTLTVFVIVVTLIFNLVATHFDEQIALFKRFDDLSNNSNNFADRDPRGASIISAFNQFVENPILGDQFVGKLDNFYPHNIFVETLMSLGLLGFVIFLVINISAIFNMTKMMNSYNPNYIFIGIFGLAIFFSSTISGCLFASPEFWLFSSLLISTRVLNK